MLDGSKKVQAIAFIVLGLGIGLTGFSIARRSQPKSPCGQQPCAASATDAGTVTLLKNYFADQGYFWAFVQQEELKGGLLRYTVTPGDVYRFDQALILGASDDWSRALTAKLPLHKGDVYRPSLARVWLDEIEHPERQSPISGYRMKKFTINTDRDKHTVSLVLEVAKEPGDNTTRGQ